jgi:hypothetical protein
MGDAFISPDPSWFQNPNKEGTEVLAVLSQKFVFFLNSWIHSSAGKSCESRNQKGLFESWPKRESRKKCLADFSTPTLA